MILELLKSDVFKIVVDSLSSLAALFAICSVIILWYRNLKAPLGVKYVIYSRDKDMLKFMVKVRNNQPYPVTIKHTRCYTKRSFYVELPPKQPPILKHGYDQENLVILDKAHHVIEPFGSTDILYSSEQHSADIECLTFDFSTSHGDYFLKCKKVVYFEMSASITFGEPITERRFYSKPKALLFYFWSRFLHWNQKS